MPSDKTNIFIALTIIGLIIAIWAPTYPHSSDLVYTNFEPPKEIKYNSISSFNFKLHNYGEKSGRYYLGISSEELLIKIGNVANKEYSNDDSTWQRIEDEEDHQIPVYIKVNETKLPNNATIHFLYLDKSPLLSNKKVVLDFIYNLDDDGRYKKYVFINKTGKTYSYFNLGNQEIRISKVRKLN